MLISRKNVIRGLYPDEVDEELAYKIGIFLGKKFKKIVVGSDMRSSSPELKRFLLKGLLESKITIIDVGVLPTPLIHFCLSKYKIEAGVAVTGSSSPKDYHGFKFLGKASVDLKDVKKIKGTGNDLGDILPQNVEDDYTKVVLSKIKAKKNARVVLDAGNGVAGMIAVKLFQKAEFDVLPLHCEPDLSFPNRSPDLSDLLQLKKKIAEKSAHVGIAYDGDGCKFAILDKNGKAVSVKNETGDAIYDSLKAAEIFSQRI
jgi:phosphomannomutase/phosphoglucomutase